MMTRFYPPLVLSLALLLTVAPTVIAQPVILRPYDALLEDTRLTDLVDAQSSRHAGPIVAALAHEDPVVRGRAALAAASVQDPATLHSLIRLLEDRDASVRADAAFALGQLRDSTAARALLDALVREDDSRALYHLYQALGESAGYIAGRGLLAHEPARAATWQYALSLARLGLRDVRRTEVASRLAAFLSHPDAETRRHAAYFFWRVNNPDAWEHLRENVRAAFRATAPDDVAAGYLALAVSGLGDVRDLGLVSVLARSSADWRTRDRAARALGRYPASDVFGTLLEATSDASHHVAETAARTLAGLADLTQAHADALEARIAHGTHSTALRGHLARALTTVESFEAAYAMADDPVMRLDALPALAKVPEPDALRRLLTFARDADDRVSASALSALIERWGSDRADPTSHRAYFDVFSDALRSLDVARIYTTAPVLSDSILVSLGSPELLRETFDRFEMPRDVEAAVAIVQAAGRIDHVDTRHILDAARRHEHPAVRRALPAPNENAPSDLRQPDWDALQAIGPRPTVRFETERGAFVVQMFADLAPVTVQTLLDLAERGEYDDVPFHRVVSDFVVQGGDFARRDGFGGPGFEIPSEFTPIRYATGTVGMASAGKDTEGSQFFVTHSMQPHLEGRYTAFGIVIEGQDVVDAIRRDDRIVSVTLLP
jgi:cyclophilin family peptidyl-prolyl cis-trans isomerase/HEAT repeat protein